MATTYGMGGGTPIMSTTMPPPPSGMGGMTAPMTTPMTTQNMGSINTGGFTRNMSLPLASNLPINVDENTPNLEEIQGFPVAGRSLDGAHFHQDPVTGQIYRMTDELHDRIPQILANRMGGTSRTRGMGTAPMGTGGQNVSPVSVTPDKVTFLPTAPEKPIILVNGEPVVNTKQTVDTNNQFPIYQPFDQSDGTTRGVRQIETTTIYPSGDRMPLSRTPINKILNIIPSSIQQLSLTKYTPINRFTSLSQNLQSTSDGNRYTPINKFYNVR